MSNRERIQAAKRAGQAARGAVAEGEHVDAYVFRANALDGADGALLDELDAAFEWGFRGGSYGHTQVVA